MDNQAFALRPMTIADMVDAAIRIYRRNFAPLLAIAAIVQVPLMALQMAAQYVSMKMLLGLEGPQASPEAVIGPALLAIGTMFGMILLILVLAPIGQAALAVGISELYLGRGITVSRAYEIALRYWPRVLWTSIILWLWIYLCSALGLIALLVGSFVVLLWLVIRYLVAPDVVVVLENRWGIDALRRSWQLTAGYYWSIFAVMAILYLMILVAAYGLTLPLAFVVFGMMRDPSQALTAQIIYQAAAAVVMIVVRPIPMIGSVLIYYDLRIRKEGFDLLMMAEALGVPAPEAYAPAPQQPLYWPSQEPAQYQQPPSWPADQQAQQPQPPQTPPSPPTAPPLPGAPSSPPTQE